MKKYSLATAFLLWPLVFLAQVNFNNGPFEEALKLSSQKGTLLFLQFESATCARCNDVADKAFEDKELAKQLEATFICLKIDSTHPDRQLISSLYNIKGFGSLFIATDKTLIHNFPKTTTLASEYKKQIDIALTKAGEDIRVSELEKQYKNGNRTTGMLELLLLKRKNLGLETDSLLDEYTSLLPADSIGAPATVKFIAQFAPVLDSKANNFLRKDYNLFNKAWFTMDLTTRSAINSRIIYKSRLKAIREKNERYAHRVADFAKSTYPTNSEGGKKTYEYNLMAFYKETNDTVNYLIRALYYYDKYYMLVSVDSVKMRDSLSLKKILASPSSNKEVIKRGDTVITKKTFSFAPLAQRYTRDINEAAWNFYTMAKDPLHLQKGLMWAERANEFFASPDAMDTWARLLYKTGDKTSAIKKEEQAIALQKKQGLPVTEYEAVLTRMKKNQAEIDR